MFFLGSGSMVQPFLLLFATPWHFTTGRSTRFMKLWLYLAVRVSACTALECLVLIHVVHIVYKYIIAGLVNPLSIMDVVPWVIVFRISESFFTSGCFQRYRRECHPWRPWKVYQQVAVTDTPDGTRFIFCVRVDITHIIKTLVSTAAQAFFVYRIYICAYGPSNPYFLLTAVQLAGRTLWHHSYG